MLGLNLAQWNDLTVVDHERLHDLLGRHNVEPKRGHRPRSWPGVWRGKRASGRSSWATSRGPATRSTSRRGSTTSPPATGSDVARVDDRTGDDVRPLFDQLAAKLLDLSGAPTELPVGSRPLHHPVARGVPALPRRSGTAQPLGPGRGGARPQPGRRARHHVRPRVLQARAHPRLDRRHGRFDRGPGDRARDGTLRATCRRTTARSSTPTAPSSAASTPRRGRLYQQLLDRDRADADAWYGLGEAWFHDTDGAQPGARVHPGDPRLQAARSTLDPDYALAYDHVQHHARHGRPSGSRPTRWWLRTRSRSRSARTDGRLVDSATLQARRPSGPRRRPRHGAELDREPARPRSAPTGRWWTPTSRPGNYDAALAEVDALPATRPRCIPSCRSSRRASASRRATSIAPRPQLRTALDTVAPQDFRPYQGTPTVVMDIAAAANVFAYQGDLANAAKALDLADQVRREVVKHPAGKSEGPWDENWRRVVLGELYAGVGRAGILPPAGLAECRRGGADGDAGLAQAPGAQRRLRRHRALHRPQRGQHGPGRVPRA